MAKTSTERRTAQQEREMAAEARARRRRMPVGSPQRLVMLEFAEAHDMAARWLEREQYR